MVQKYLRKNGGYMKRILPIILALFLMGCGTATTETEVPETETVQATAEKQDGNVTLRIWGSENDQAMLAQMGESFKEKYDFKEFSIKSIKLEEKYKEIKKSNKIISLYEITPKQRDRNKINCQICGKEIEKKNKTKLCLSCCSELQKNNLIISRNDLKYFIRKYPFSAIAAALNVSTSSIKRWCVARKLPNTKENIPVDTTGCPLDSDKDGVADFEDKCPNTLPGVKIDKKGCPVNRKEDLERLKKGIAFETGSTKLTKASYATLDDIIKLMKKIEAANLEVQGHTDNTGSEKTNEKLSQGRAQAVVDYFVEKGIAPNRVRAVGFGSRMPIADNKTKAGRAKNRRVELVPFQ
jgi:outer membrane protein OmpA-like peptidoglycan-associated protein